ncbi:MAG: DUF475 domain-containing protein [Spirochaetia bacterium]|nr:DUF475 domain-containing protein [Spirochaetia bacterium]
MQWANIILTISGLALFELICSIDNAIINAEILSTMQERARKWFLLWGFGFAVFFVRGFLPLMIVYVVNPSLGLWGAFTAMFSHDPEISRAIEASAPILYMGGGIFLLFLALYWLFLEEKNIGMHVEKIIMTHGFWFYAIASIILTVVVWFSMQMDTLRAFGAVVGSSVFFITHGFKHNAEESEKKLIDQKSGRLSDLSKLLYLEVIDTTFSIDGVLGAFAFTLAVPLILVGNAFGAYAVRRLTIGNIEKIKNYLYLKNGAMYSILALGVVMLADGFSVHVPTYVSPGITFLFVGYFYWKSIKHPEYLKTSGNKKKDKKNKK